MKRFVIKMLAVIASISLMGGLLFWVICAQSVSTNFYLKEYRKLGVAENIGISAEDLENATEILLDYTSGKREDMITEADFDGQRKEVFNDREKAHMVDVRALFLGARTFSRIATICGAVLLAALLIFTRERKTILRGYRLGNYIFLGIFVIIALYAAVDFTSFWTSFHHVFFTNDLWLLDPATCNLILMVPEQFFFDLVFRIVAWFVGIGAVLYILSWIFEKMKKGERTHVS